MTKNNNLASYFVRISQLGDQLKAIDEQVSDKELVAVAINGLSDSCDASRASISGRENAPSFDKIWASYTQEESRLMSKGKDTESRCPQGNDDRKRKGKRHASATNLNEPSYKRRPRKKDYDDEYSFYYAFIGSIAGGNISSNYNLYVPGLKKNLLSISSLEDKGYGIAFVDGQVLLWKKDSSFESPKVIGLRIGGLYRLRGYSIQALICNTSNLCQLWHQRYTHVHYKALSRMKDFVKGISKIKIEHDGACKGCVLGEKGRFTRSDSKSEGILDLIHSDVCAPMSNKSLGGHLYYVTFIDDYSHTTWIYFLKSKDEVFEKFLEFKA
eukprot:PITA_27514